MSPLEFKAWFDGFANALTAAPTEQQWAVVKQKVESLDANVIPAPRPGEVMWRNDDNAPKKEKFVSSAPYRGASPA